MTAYDKRAGVLLLISILAVVVLFLIDPIAQDPRYHVFADTRSLLGIENFWNVISSSAFAFVGGYGLIRYQRLSQPRCAQGYLAICIGVLLVGFGSAYYHLAPSNASLLWDRLPMTVAFMALLSLLLDERVVQGYNRSILWLLIALGIGSALYWAWTESLGRGDLRPYVLVQFLPVILLPLILLLFRQRYLNDRFMFMALAWYFVAKAFEHFDAEIYAALDVMGGHALKHVAASAAVLCILCSVPVQKLIR